MGGEAELLYYEPLIKRYKCLWISNVDRCSHVLVHLFLGSLYEELMNPRRLILCTFSYLVMSRSDRYALCVDGVDIVIDGDMYV